jgi:copper(I)-binding protein
MRWPTNTLSRRNFSAGLIVSLLPAMAHAQGTQPKFYVGDGRARAAVAGAAKTTLYFTIYNSTDQDDALIGVYCPWAEKATIERTRWKGIKSYQVPLDEVPVPAHHVVKLKPGEIDIKLERPTRAFTAGLKVPVELKFRTFGTIATDVEVFNRLL